MKSILESIRALGMARVVMMVGVTLGVLGAFIWLEVEGPGRSRMTLLASDLEPRAAQQLTAELGTRRIPFRQDGGQVFVPDGDLANARMLLAAGGYGGGDVTGYEIFDRGTDLAVTDFDQQVKLTRALEGELARTIVAVPGISRARVHLVLPRREPFARERQQARASVMLMLAGRRTLSPEAVQSVVNLVAAGVPGLRPQDVTVVDSNLHLLSQAGDTNDGRAKSALEEDIRQRTQTRLAQAVELMLERSLGPGHVHAEASIRMNFDKINETQEKYDPDGQVVRSTQSVTSNNKTTDRSGPTSVQNNLPNADAGAVTSGSQEGRQEETTNYEIGKTVRAIVHDTPQVDRITLAVMVDGVDTVDADGKRAWKARDQADLDRIEKLVKSAIGFDEKRGDHLDVVSMPFVTVAEPADTAAPVKVKATNDLLTFVQVVAFGVVVFGIIILTARSVLAGLNRRPPGLMIAEEQTPELTSSMTQAIEGGDPADPAMIGDDEDTVTITNIQGQMRASSIRKVTQLVDRHPDTTLGIIRGWISTEQG